MKFSIILSFFILLAAVVPCYSQQKDSATTVSSLLNSNYTDKVDKKVKGLQSDIEKKSLKTLAKLQKQEQKLQKKLALKDSVAAKALFAQTKYKQLTEQLRNPAAVRKLKEYIPQFDSLKTSLKFLNDVNTLSAKMPARLPEGLPAKLPAGLGDKIKNANTDIAGLENKMQQANEITAYIKERKQLLKTQLEKFGMLKDMKAMNKEAYYYQAQMKEYKEILKDPSKIEKKALAQLTKLPAFTAFMKKNSQLASLFKMPDNAGSAESLAGLQTRASVQNIIQAKFSGSGVNPQQYIGQQMQQAQGELNKLKDKLNKAGGGSGDIEMPDFKPNSQKTKSFLKRIEYGANVQSQRPNGLLPVTTDFALTAGYKLNDKSIIGLGSSYKMGWGSGISHIKLSSQGIGLRSYTDVKIKGGFWMTGGYELNYQHEFTKLANLPSVFRDGSGVRPWQKSGLLGITKKYKIGKTTNSLQVLWDFLSYGQVPRRQPIVFRVGYVF